MHQIFRKAKGIAIALALFIGLVWLLSRLFQPDTTSGGFADAADRHMVAPDGLFRDHHRPESAGLEWPCPGRARRSNPWSAIAGRCCGVFIFLAVMCFNFVGDGLRDAAERIRIIGGDGILTGTIRTLRKGR
jgi:hypothetical protein